MFLWWCLFRLVYNFLCLVYHSPWYSVWCLMFLCFSLLKNPRENCKKSAWRSGSPRARSSAAWSTKSWDVPTECRIQLLGHCIMFLQCSSPISNWDDRFLFFRSPNWDGPRAAEGTTVFGFHVVALVKASFPQPVRVPQPVGEVGWLSFWRAKPKSANFGTMASRSCHFRFSQWFRSNYPTVGS